MRRLLLFLGLMFLCEGMAMAQKRSVAFYNVENMFDTVPSLFYDDSDYTPEGLYKWNTERYNRKVSDIARVLDDMRADVVGLAEIENERVVRDLVRALNTDYCYVHIVGGDKMGRDLAFLYKADRFEIGESRLLESGTSREFLMVSGKLLGQKVHFIVCHLPSVFQSDIVRDEVLERLRVCVKQIRLSEPEVPVIVLGDMNWVYTKRRQKMLGYQAPLLSLSAQGYGSYYVDGRWQLIDNIFLCGGQVFCVVDCGIYIRNYMMKRTAYETSPYRTFTRSRYVGGISDHLPVYVILERELVQ